MSKFKVRDKVRVINNFIKYERSHIGRYSIIKDIFVSDRVDILGYYVKFDGESFNWAAYEDELNLVVEPLVIDEYEDWED